MSDISLAIEMLEQGHREDAIRELEKILAEDIDQISAWRLMASAVTNPNEIKECYEQILRLNPHDAEAIEVLRSLGAEEVSGDVLPFIEDNFADTENNWEGLDEPPAQPGIDTSPINIIATVLEPIPQDETIQEAQPAQSSEALLFDEEPSPTAEEKGGGLLDNDAIYYTLIILAVIAVLAILFFLFRNSLMPLLNSILPK
jgi:tetratricopeptide (TPR) repeat protein